MLHVTSQGFPILKEGSALCGFATFSRTACAGGLARVALENWKALKVRSMCLFYFRFCLEQEEDVYNGDLQNESELNENEGESI